MTKVFCAALASETNTFSPIATTKKHFEEWFYHRAGEHPDDGPTLFTCPYWAAKTQAETLGWTVVQGLSAAAFPSGRIVRADYEALRDELLEDLKQALPVEVVLLGLHGAMAADGYDDCEGDILRKVREIVGPEVVIGCELDPHAHLTDEMVEASDALIAFKQYPHTDALDRAFELVDLVERIRRKEVSPVIAVADVAMIAQFFTTQSPASGLIEDMMAAERSPEILTASLIHGFASADVVDMRTKVLVISDGDAGSAERWAKHFCEAAWQMRSDADAPRLPVDQAVAEAMASPGLTVLADGADNPGGGAPGDSTYILSKLIEAKASGVVVGPLWDPVAVEFAAARGIGSRLSLRIGGKASALSGHPIDLDVEVIGFKQSVTQSFGGANWPMGDMVGVRAEGLEVALCSLRNQGFSPQLFRDVGIEPTAASIIVIKSNHHFRAAFEGISDAIIYVCAPGVAVVNPKTVDYQRVRRPIWPVDPVDDCRSAQHIMLKER